MDIFRLEQAAGETIMQRRSYRNYRPQPIPENILAMLREGFASGIEGPFGSRPQLLLIEDSGAGLRGVPGTYGVIRGARHFIAAVDRADWKEQTPEDIGYALESVILWLTELGLGSCWMGGTFNPAHFQKMLELPDDRRVVALTPLGYPEEKRHGIDRIFRRVAGSAGRKALSEILSYESGEGLHPFTEGAELPLSFSPEMLELLRWAPSASNRQPWRWVLKVDRMELWLQRTKNYRKAFLPDMQRMDMGIAMSHWDALCRDLGRSGLWDIQRQDVNSEGVETVLMGSWLPDPI